MQYVNSVNLNTRVKLRVQGLTNSQIQSGAYALILAEEAGQRRIPIIVGTAEAQSIAIALEHITPPRPLTHDLFSAFFKSFSIRLQEVFIYKFEEGVFYSELLFNDGIHQVKLDSRTSDAIAIALRVQCNIYTTEAIMQECSVMLEDTSLFDDREDEDESAYALEPEEMKDENQFRKWLTLLDDEELKSKLEEAIANENYEYAKIYKDELHRRENKGE
ncbi:bifunctional DNase/RNase [Parabacteroides sp. PF5-5]|nr:bifunctional DNase/RNase [Parabacteroides sp. PH5-39]MDH6316476.1 bifunctional DNase/RNase [Parabacteroides sp. PF5-13]MDH6319986.1 bifunctional DNase/RNase [Parabacteroides sp. PH5-13]MDH6323781.1 bifunctional DNase/RNase [Parabacteroides sp. PH5-8]MDH6327663.1 bifunctional DNase/RNase [Parabacteroides sp. PH5-41]MDH6335464.1 bifunctional DNase/RNase [Parabacteroides sp. PF5-5]MDH6346592.1 bifunctional DNase/RNase [Parabacteroides sp. PH5-46]MDH6361554.1 bifunctional DNase/RNase [Parabac